MSSVFHKKTIKRTFYNIILKYCKSSAISIYKTPFTRYRIHVVTTSISASLRSYLLSPFFLWLAVKFCNNIVNLRATHSSRNYQIWCRDYADPLPCKRGLRLIFGFVWYTAKNYHLFIKTGFTMLFSIVHSCQQHCWAQFRLKTGNDVGNTSTLNQEVIILCRVPSAQLCLYWLYFNMFIVHFLQN